MTYRLVITPTGLKLLEAISDRRIREQICARIDGLAHDPEQQGKPLRGELARFRSVYVASQRYRILYRVDRDQLLVMVVAVGIRKEGDRRDMYQLAQKLVRLRLI